MKDEVGSREGVIFASEEDGYRVVVVVWVRSELSLGVWFWVGFELCSFPVGDPLGPRHLDQIITYKFSVWIQIGSDL